MSKGSRAKAKSPSTSAPPGPGKPGLPSNIFGDVFKPRAFLGLSWMEWENVETLSRIGMLIVLGTLTAALIIYIVRRGTSSGCLVPSTK
jgi:hypothetical protein